jgi:uncharacterized protein with FMN-binding domain
LPTEPGRRPALAPPPRRAVAAILATALGLVLLFSFKTPDEAPVPSRPVAVAPAPSAGTTSPNPVGGVSSPSASASASQAPKGGTHQVDGTVVSTRFGDVQVRLIESGNTITDVQALQLPFDRRRSLEISQFVAPILHDEALQAQSAQIDTISGATYTSEAYSTSLQSALDHVHG